MTRLTALIGVFALTGWPAFAEEPATASRYMVVAANPHASEAGRRILSDGGSAVDAAIAVQLVLSLVEPQSSGIGGGAFMLYFDAPGDADGEAGVVEAYQGRETAPAAATPDMFLDADANPLPFPVVGVGGLSVGVPGVMRMLEMAHRDHGRLPWAALFAPAIELAEGGFEISPRLYFLLDRFERFASGEEFIAHYYDENGKAYETGHRLVNEDYAATLRLLAAEGADAMYTGELAEAIVEEVRENNVRAGRMTLDDLRNYEARKTEPLCSPYREWRICGPQLPSSGGVSVQQMLGVLGHFDLAGVKGEPQATHLIAEAGRLAFADRSLYLGDPDFVDVPVAELLDPDYLMRRASLIDAENAMKGVAPGNPLRAAAWNFSASLPQERVSTSHFSIVDSQGDAVSMTTSVQGAFGSQLMVGGFILNNQLTDFSYEPSRLGRPVANRIDGGKRPLSSMAPTLVFDEAGRLRLAIGSPGGTRIINFVAQTILNVLDFDMNVQEAISAPHIVAQHDGPIELEEDSALLAQTDALEAMGHRVLPRNLNSGLHGIAIDYAESGTVLSGGVDPRREGAALGE